MNDRWHGNEGFQSRRVVVSMRESFEVHDYTDDPFTFFCKAGCPGHKIERCEDRTPGPIVSSNDVPLGAELRAEADAELDRLDALDQADDDLRDQWDTMGGIPPDAEYKPLDEERDQ